MPELGDIYSNFFSDEHMCMRAAESDGAGRREGEEKSGATLYDRMQLVESWFTLMGEAVKKEGGKIILYTWCLEWISLLTRNLHITSIYFSSHRLPIDRSSPRPHRRQELSLHSLVGLFNSAPGPGESRSCGCCSSRQNKLVQFSFYSGLVCYHIPVSHPSSDRCPHPLSMTLRHILPSSQSPHPSSPFPYHLPDNPAPKSPIQPLSFVLAPVITTCFPLVSCPRLGHPPPLHGINPTPLQILTRALALVPSLTSLCHLWMILLSLP